MSITAAMCAIVFMAQAVTARPGSPVPLRRTLQSFAQAEAFAVSRDGRFLAVGTSAPAYQSGGRQLVVIDITRRGEVARTSVPADVTTLAFSSKGGWLAVATRD